MSVLGAFKLPALVNEPFVSLSGCKMSHQTDFNSRLPLNLGLLRGLKYRPQLMTLFKEMLKKYSQMSTARM